MPQPSDGPESLPDAARITLQVRCSEPRPLALPDLNNFLYDFNAAYEIIRLAYGPDYVDTALDYERLLYRDGRPLRAADRLHLDWLRYQSPVEWLSWVKATLEAIVAVGKFSEWMSKYIGVAPNTAPSTTLEQRRAVTQRQLIDIERQLHERDRVVQALHALSQSPHAPSGTSPSSGVAVSGAARPVLTARTPNQRAIDELEFIGNRIAHSPVQVASVVVGYSDPNATSRQRRLDAYHRRAVTTATNLLALQKLPPDHANRLAQAVNRVLSHADVDSLLALHEEIGRARGSLNVPASDLPPYP